MFKWSVDHEKLKCLDLSVIFTHITKYFKYNPLNVALMLYKRAVNANITMVVD